MDYVYFGCRCLIGAVFIASVAGKTGNASFREFTRATRTLLAALLPRKVSRKAAQPVSVAVLAAEVSVPVMLAPAATVRLGLGVAAVLLLGFGVFIAAALKRGVNASCRCFGTSSAAPLRKHHLFRNALLIAAALAGMAGPRDLGSAHTGGLVLAGGVGLVVAVLVARMDDLIYLVTPWAGSATLTPQEGTHDVHTHHGGGTGGSTLPTGLAAHPGSGAAAAGTRAAPGTSVGSRPRLLH
ncbi:MauE/DoxX family redox-associated membrane protein [Actinomadura rudentiformis]|uniref:MauE/DoxX family redox-associated membrane protein n=1 Tax=Actinomadura rudentiformis TaxID=359158 RepID=UPI00178C22ED|nr:MauE/DoxX family redox-associated membrane protein [Actinomadura rudentiformis]